MRELVIILSHGSKSRNSNVLTEKVAGEVGAKLGIRTVFANLQLSPPYLDQIIEAEYSAGVRRFIIHPFFLHKGVHVEDDIPSAVDSMKARHSDAEFVLTPVLGEHPAIGNAVVEVVKAAVCVK